MDTTGASDEGFQRLPDTQFTASVFGGSGYRRKEMLRKKYHVVRKKYHVVRKLFYVASIFGGAAGRKNRPPWKKPPTAWELSSTAGTLFPTASLSVRDRTLAFLGGRSNKFTGHRYVGNKPVPLAVCKIGLSSALFLEGNQPPCRRRTLAAYALPCALFRASHTAPQSSGRCHTMGIT